MTGSRLTARQHLVPLTPYDKTKDWSDVERYARGLGGRRHEQSTHPYPDTKRNRVRQDRQRQNRATRGAGGQNTQKKG